MTKFKLRNKFSLIADTTYALLLYMLYAKDNMLLNTTYYVGTTLSTLPLYPKIVMPPIKHYTDKELIKYRIRCLKYRLQLCRSEIYAQDHLYFSAPLIDNHPYILLEDCPRFFTTLYNTNNKKSLYIKKCTGLRHLMMGRIYNQYGGYNIYCKNRIVTSDSDKCLFDSFGLKNEQYNIQQLWNSASEFKKKYIKRIFMIDDKMVTNHQDVIIFSQPLITDCHLSVSEHLALFKPYIDQYGIENIIVKLHPRDTFDYQKYFPGIKILSTKAPQQLLSAMGLRLRIAITVCSSAVSSMDKNTEIVWIGAEVDDRIVKAYGHVQCPVLT